MRTWVKNGLRLTILMTMLAGAGAGMAYSATSTDRFSLQADQSEDGQNPAPGTDGETDSPMLGRRAPIAGLIGLTVTALGVVLLIRRRRAGQDDQA